MSFFSSSIRYQFETVERSEDQEGLCRLKQVHGVDGYEVRYPKEWTTREGDWLCTYEKSLRIGVFVADCTAVLVEGQNTEGEFVAAIHAGWRGTAAGILQDFVGIMQPLPGIKAWLSPSICQKHFEVGPEVVEAMGKSVRPFIESGKEDRWHLDLKGLQTSWLEKMGVKVDASPLCTTCEDDMVSYRQSGPNFERRHLAWIERL